MRTYQKGFSLIELMIVVAIIGILSAIAVPQFQTFQRKARQSEVRSMLSAIYVGQKTFFSEHTTYWPNLITLGFLPEGSLKYVVGHDSGITMGLPSVLPSNAYTDSIQFYDTLNICSTTFAGNRTIDTAGHGLNLSLIHI